MGVEGVDSLVQWGFGLAGLPLLPLVGWVVEGLCQLLTMLGCCVVLGLVQVLLQRKPCHAIATQYQRDDCCGQ